MMRISLPWLFGVMEDIDDIERLVPGTVLDNLGVLLGAQARVEMVFDQSIYGQYLRASRAAGTMLHDALSKHLNVEKWEEAKITDYDIAAIKRAKATFKTIFVGDLSALPSYLVAPKDNFDVTRLIENGVRLFPESLMTKAPEIEKDANEAGRALAFELPTACGFHTFRVTESVVRRYWDQVSGGTDRPKLETLGNFAAEMEKNSFGDPKVIEAIKQMTKLHRNPLIHPEVILNNEEAIGIVGMARSVIAAMLKTLPDAPTTTGAPSSTPS